MTNSYFPLQHQPTEFRHPERLEATANTQLLNDVLSLCRSTMENAQNAELYAEENKRAIDSAMRELSKLAQDVKHSLEPQRERNASQILSALSDNRHDLKTFEASVIERQKALEHVVVSIADRFDKSEDRLELLFEKLDRIEIVLKDHMSKKAGNGDEINDRLETFRDKLDENGRAQLTAINLVANRLASISDADNSRDIQLEHAIGKIALQIEALSNVPKTADTATPAALEDITRSLNELDLNLQNINSISRTTVDRIDRLPERLQNEISKFNLNAGKKLTDHQNRTTHSFDEMHRVLMALSDRIEEYAGQTTLDIAGFQDRIETLCESVPNSVQQGMTEIRQANDKEREEFYASEKAGLAELIENFRTLANDLEANTNGLRQSVLAVHNEAGKLGEKLHVDLKQAPPDLDPIVNKVTDLCNRVESSVEEISGQAGGAIQRIEELEERRLASVKGMEASEKESINRQLIGFRMILERLDKGTSEFTEMVEHLNKTKLLQDDIRANRSDLPNNDLPNLEAVSAALSDAVASIEPRVMEAVSSAIVSEDTRPTEDHSETLLSQLLLESISKMNMICTDLQASAEKLKHDDNVQDPEIMKGVAERTGKNASEITDVIAVLHNDLVKVIEGGRDNQKQK